MRTSVSGLGGRDGIDCQEMREGTWLRVKTYVSTTQVEFLPLEAPTTPRRAALEFQSDATRCGQFIVIGIVQPNVTICKEPVKMVSADFAGSLVNWSVGKCRSVSPPPPLGRCCSCRATLLLPSGKTLILPPRSYIDIFIFHHIHHQRPQNHSLTNT